MSTPVVEFGSGLASAASAIFHAWTGPSHRLASSPLRPQGSRVCSALVVGVTAALALSTACAASITQTQNEDPEMCADFTRMLKAADLVHLSADELCVLRFASLPGSTTSGFSFPAWSQLETKDKSVEGTKMYEDNLLERDKGKNSLLAHNLVDATESAASEGNLTFATTQIKLDSHAVMTVESMDIRKCSNTTFEERREDQSIRRRPYAEYDLYPSFAMYQDAARTKPIPVTPFARGGQLALWRGKRWVQLSITPRWNMVGPAPVLIASLQRFKPIPQSEAPYGRVQEQVMSYYVCETKIAR